MEVIVDQFCIDYGHDRQNHDQHLVRINYYHRSRQYTVFGTALSWDSSTTADSDSRAMSTKVRVATASRPQRTSMKAIALLTTIISPLYIRGCVASEYCS